MASKVDLVGVGSPIVDVLARVSESFVAGISGGKGGTLLVEAHELESIVEQAGAVAEVPGGSAGNTVYAAANLGTKVSFLGTLGNDRAGDFYRSRFSGIGADTSRFRVSDAPNGRCVSLVTPDGQRTMRTHLGAALDLGISDISASDFEGCRHVHVEGYMLYNLPVIQHLLCCAKTQKCTVSLDLASFEVIQRCLNTARNILYSFTDIVFANEDEASAFFEGKKMSFESMALKLSETCPIAVVKLGKNGSLIASKGRVMPIAPVPVATVVDTTGAGDYWAGGFLHAWLKGLPLEECGRWGSVLGAEIVQVMGACLPEEAWQRIRTLTR